MTIYGVCQHYDCPLRNNAGYCRVTVCMNEKYNGWCNKEQEIENRRNVNPDEFKKAVEQYRKQRMTNADRIRSMSDEELAHLLHSAEEHLFTGNLWNYAQWKDWLKQEANDGKDN